MKLLTTLRAEMLKTKRTASFYFTLLIAFPIPAIFALNVLTGGEDTAVTKMDALNAIFALNAERNSVIFLPMFVILVCTLLPQIEYRNNTWKQVLSSPQSKGNVFLAKFLNINLLLLLFLFANILFMLLAIVIIHVFVPSLDLFSQPLDGMQLLVNTANAYVTMLAVCSFQFWLGLRFRNFIIPTAVGLALWFTGMIMTFEFNSNVVEYYPYSFQIFPFMSKLQPKVTQVVWTSLAYAAAFLLLGFLDFRKRRLTS